MSVLGHRKDELLAVHIVKSIIVQKLVLLHDREIGKMSPSDRYKVDVVWNNCFKKSFNACWWERAKPLLFYCNTMSASFLADQRKNI